MLVAPISAMILVQTSLKLSVIQDLVDMTQKLKESVKETNNTNLALRESIKVIESDIVDIHTNICLTTNSRNKRQVMVAIGAGLTAAFTTLIVTGERLINYISPHGDQLHTAQQEITQHEVQLKLEKDDRANIENIADRLNLFEEAERIKLLTDHTKEVVNQFLRPDAQTPTARRVRERTVEIYYKKFKKYPINELDYATMMTYSTHFESFDGSHQCKTSNLTLTYETSFPTSDTKLQLTSPLTATDDKNEKCFVLVGTKRATPELIYAQYPLLEVERNLTLCSHDDTSICHTILTPVKLCISPAMIHIENSRITVFTEVRAEVSCRKSSDRSVTTTHGLTFSPVPQCDYKLNIGDLVVKIQKVPIFSTAVFDTELHISKSFLVHNRSINWSTDPQELVNVTYNTDVHSTTNTVLVAILSTLVMVGLFIGYVFYKRKQTTKTNQTGMPSMVKIEMQHTNEQPNEQTNEPLLSRTTSVGSNIPESTSAFSVPGKPFDPDARLPRLK